MRLSLFLRSIYWKMALILFLASTFVLLGESFLSKDDIINKIQLYPRNQQRILNLDLMIRDSVLAKYAQIEKLDSISKQLISGSKDSTEATRLLRDLVHMKLTNTTLAGHVLLDKSNLSWHDIGLLEYDNLNVTIKVENDKLITILTHSQSLEEDKKLIKFGNYISNQTEYQLKARFDLLILLLLVSILLTAVLFFVIEKAKQKDKEITDQIATQIKLISSLSKNDAKRWKVEIDTLYTMLRELYTPEPKLDVATILKGDYVSFREKAQEMNERSSLFLVFSFAISIGGIIIFYLLLPQYAVGMTFANYLGFTLRPLLVLSFFQTLAFYLLKQYKGSMEDYKFFYLEARNRKRFLMVHSILQSEESEKIIAYGILTDIAEETGSKEDKSNVSDSADGLANNFLNSFKDLAKEKLKLNGE